MPLRPCPPRSAPGAAGSRSRGRASGNVHEVLTPETLAEDDAVVAGAGLLGQLGRLDGAPTMAFMVTSRGERLGRRELSPSSPSAGSGRGFTVDADAAGLPLSTATLTMAVKLSSWCLPPTLPGLIRYFARPWRSRVLGQEDAVVVEVADDGRLHCLTISGTAFAAASLLTVTRTSSLPAASVDLGDRPGDVGRVGVGHGLDDDGPLATDLDAADVDQHGLPALGEAHISATISRGSGASRGPRDRG